MKKIQAIWFVFLVVTTLVFAQQPDAVPVPTAAPSQTVKRMSETHALQGRPG